MKLRTVRLVRLAKLVTLRLICRALLACVVIVVVPILLRWKIGRRSRLVLYMVTRCRTTRRFPLMKVILAVAVLLLMWLRALARRWSTRVLVRTWRLPRLVVSRLRLVMHLFNCLTKCRSVRRLSTLRYLLTHLRYFIWMITVCQVVYHVLLSLWPVTMLVSDWH